MYFQRLCLYGVMVNASKSRSKGRGFDSWPFHSSRQVLRGRASTTKRLVVEASGNVAVGLVVTNGSQLSRL